MDDIKASLIPVEILQSIDVQLQEMSKRQPLRRQRRYSQLDLVKAKYSEIEALVDRGFSIEEIAKCFMAANEPLEASTLRSYLSRIRAADKTGARRRRKTKQKKNPSTTSCLEVKPSTHVEKKDTPATSAQDTRSGSTTVNEHVEHHGEQSSTPQSALERAKEKLRAIGAEQKVQRLWGSFEVIEDRPDL